MAGRFLFHKFPSSGSGMSRSTSRLISGHASASARGATAPVTPTPRASSEAGISILTSNASHVAAVHPVGMVAPANNGIQGYAARYYLNTFPCSRATAKTGWSATGNASSIINQKKSAFVASVGGLKRNCSSGASTKLSAKWVIPRVGPCPSNKLGRHHDWIANLAEWKANKFVAWTRWFRFRNVLYDEDFIISTFEDCAKKGWSIKLRYGWFGASMHIDPRNDPDLKEKGSRKSEKVRKLKQK